MANFDSNAYERLLPTNPHANHQRRTVPQHLGDGLIDAFPPAQRSSDQKRNMVNSEQDRWLQELKARMGIIQNVNSHGICSRTYAEASNSDFGEAYKRPAPPPPQPPLVISPFHYSGGAAFIPPNFFPVTPKPQARLYEYGDCSETLPLSVAASFSSPIGPAIEVHSLAAFTSQLCDIKSIAEDGTLDLSIPLKEPCKNCKSLMERIPGRARILAGSGMSDNVQWTVEKRGGNVHHKQLQHILSGYNGFSYSAAYAANENTIYETLKVWTLQNDGALRADVRTNLATMWHEFIAPYR
jgi:hypothetical protein